MRTSTGHDFIDPAILKILKESIGPMSTLGVNYRINEIAGKVINLNVIRNHLLFLVKSRKISERLDNENGVTYYTLLV
jgi:hypothetical protein